MKSRPTLNALNNIIPLSPTLSGSAGGERKKFVKKDPVSLFMFVVAPLKAVMEQNQDLSDALKSAIQEEKARHSAANDASASASSASSTPSTTPTTSLKKAGKLFAKILKATIEDDSSSAYEITTPPTIAIGVLRKMLKWLQPEWIFVTWDPLYSMPPSG